MYQFFFITEIVYTVDFLAIYKKTFAYLNAAWSDLISNFMYKPVYIISLIYCLLCLQSMQNMWAK